MIQKSFTSGSLAETRHYFYSNDWQVLEERVGTSTTADRQFVWGNRYIDDLVLRDRSVGSILNERFYGLQDVNWNLTAIVDPDGNVQERYRYDPYSKTSVLKDTFSSRSLSLYGWEIRFSGFRWEATSDVYIVRRRYLHSYLGCWITRDPIEYKGDDLNLYCFVKDNSLTNLDPRAEEVYIVCSTIGTGVRPILGLGPLEIKIPFYHCGIVVCCNGKVVRYDGGGEEVACS